MEPMLEKNLKLLRELFPDLAAALSGPSDGSIGVVMSRDGFPVPVMDRGGKKFHLHSRYDPVTESERFMGGIDVEKHDLFILFGLGFGYHLERLMGRMAPHAAVVVVEKDREIFRSLLERRDLSGILNDRRTRILIDPDEESLSRALKGKSSRSVSFITHRGSYQAYPEYYSDMLEMARSHLSTKDVNIATLAKFEKIWGSNIARNIGNFFKSPGANIFYDRFRGMPAIVVSAGPTLTRSLDFIRRNRDRALIIAVDTAMKILNRNGIEPHFCLAVDPQVINARYFEGIRPGKTVLITEPTVHPSVFRLFGGRVAVAGVAFDIMKWIETIAGEKGEITHGGSVSTNAYDFARRTGASPVCLVGQDLAFTWGMAHAAGSYLEEQIFISRDRLKNELMHNRYQLTALPKIFVRGIRSPRVQTNHKMMIFRAWFERLGHRDLINATWDGAELGGITHRSSEEIEFLPSGTDIQASIDEIYSGAAAAMAGHGPARERLAERITGMLAQVDQLIPVLERARGFSRTLLEEMKGGGRDRGKVDYILRKLSEADAVIGSKKNIKDMISLTIQRVIHTVNEGYEMDDEDGDLDENGLVAKKSLYLYQGLMEGALFNRKILEKMRRLTSRSAI